MKSVLTKSFFFIKSTFIPILVLISCEAFSQTQTNPFSFSGYIETYYSYDFNRPSNHLRPDFLYNFKRHAELNMNLGLVSAQYHQDKIRSTASLMLGNYGQYNLADEPQWAQFIYEASIGVKISNSTWVDVGIMPSHIGFETAIGADNWHLSRSLLAENSPYYLSGARLSSEIDEKTEFTFWIANGWQKIQIQENHTTFALGIKINRNFSKNLSMSYANFLVNENPYRLWLPRFFNNYFLTYTTKNWGFIGGTDFGIQKTFQNMVNWQGYTISVRRKLANQFYGALRGEYYSDPNGVILNEGMKITGFSSNIDYQLQDNALFRIEFRQFLSPEPVFSLPGAKYSIGNYALTTSLSVKF